MENTTALKRIANCKATQAPSLDLSDFQFTDEDFPMRPLLELVHLPALTLSLGSTDLISRLEKMDNGLLDQVTTLRLYGREVFDLRPLVYLQNLKKLDLYDTDVADLTLLTAFPNLTSLALCGNPRLDIRSLFSLTQLVKFEYHYDNRDWNFPGDFLPFLSQLKNLKRLCIGLDEDIYRYFFGVDLNWIADLPHLESLYVDVPLAELKSSNIAKLEGLRALNLNPSWEDHPHLIGGQLLNLEVLVFNDIHWPIFEFEESDLRPLSNLVNLKKLDIGDHIIHGFHFLQGMKSLEELYIGNGSLIENLDSLGQLYPLASLGFEEDFRDKLRRQTFESLESYFSTLKPLNISGRKVKLKVSHDLFWRGLFF